MDLIIGGFIGEFPVLCSLRNGDIVWETNFCMIGNGAYTAEPAMHARKHVDQTPLYTALYHVYEAKRLGEASPSVGKHTTILVLSPPELEALRIDVVTEEGLNHLCGLFAQYGPKAIPQQYGFPENGLGRA